MSQQAVLSDTSAASPTPFSPFSSAFSVSSEATVVSEAGGADLGAFQSVFIALSQLQQHHSQQTHHATITVEGRAVTSNSTTTNTNTRDTTRTNTPSVQVMSPLTLEAATYSDSPSRTTGSTGKHDRNPSRSTVDGESAQDGDEESIALTSPNSRPSSSFPEEVQDGVLWEVSSYRQEGSTVDSGEDSGNLRYTNLDDPFEPDENSPSLGDLDSAFAFFAAERAKLARQLEVGKGLAPPASPVKGGTGKGKGAANRNRRPFGKGRKGSFNPSQSGDLEALDEAGTLGQSLPSSSSLDDKSLSPLVKRNGLIRLSKPIPVKSNTPNPRRPGNHRHSRSLPIDASTISTLNNRTKIQNLARSLTAQFPSDSRALKRVIADPERALGLGTHVTPSDDALVAGGFFDPFVGADGRTTNSTGPVSDSLLYVFIDQHVVFSLHFSRILMDASYSSNILVGFLEWLKKQASPSQGKPKLSHPALVLLLERGRQCVRRILVASSPLYQSLDAVAGMGYQISVLQRVEIKEGAQTPSRHNRSGSKGSLPNGSSPNRPAARRNGKNAAASGSNSNTNSFNGTPNAGSSTESDSGGQNQNQNQKTTAAPIPIAKGRGHKRHSSVDQGTSPPTARPRFREEAVDELLQLKLLQTLLDSPSPPPQGSTIVLASGDAARSQFNPQGFLGCVRKAVQRGWNVEVVGWEEGRSRAWGELAGEIERGGEEYAFGGRLEMVSLDKWGMDLLEA